MRLSYQPSLASLVDLDTDRFVADVRADDLGPLLAAAPDLLRAATAALAFLRGQPDVPPGVRLDAATVVDVLARAINQAAGRS